MKPTPGRKGPKPKNKKQAVQVQKQNHDEEEIIIETNKT